MSIRRIQLTFACLVVPVGAYGAQPVIENFSPVDAPGMVMVATSSDFVDVPGTSKTVTLPAGRAVGFWHVGMQNSFALVRLAIGNQAPESSQAVYGIGSLSVNGESTMTIQAGTYDVRLQVAESNGQNQVYISPNLNTSWTLIVFPDETAGAPTVSEWGLAFMVIIGLIVGTLLFRRSVHAHAA